MPYPPCPSPWLECLTLLLHLLGLNALPSSSVSLACFLGGFRGLLPPSQPDMAPAAPSPDPATGSGTLRPSSCADTPQFSFFISLASLGLSCDAWGLHWGVRSVVATRGLSLGLEGSVVGSCGRHCSTACGIFIPQPGIKPVSPVLQGRFLTTGPPGKPPTLFSSPAGSSLPALVWPAPVVPGDRTVHVF